MATQLNTVATHLHAVKIRIAEAAKASGREPNTIQLLAVSKTKPVSDIVLAYENGQVNFGENYIQESLEKIQQLEHLNDILWHFIGPLQSNKSKFVAQHFDWMHSLDRIKLAKRLNEQRPGNKVPLNICVQVNIDGEKTKAGISANEVLDFISELQAFENIRCHGLMTIPKADADDTERRDSFLAMQSLFTSCQKQFEHIDTLSMGMSADLPLAIECGSTMVRVGTDIFGSRK